MCLMALDKADAVPVDTHVWRMAREHYGAAPGARSLTARVHQEIGEGPKTALSTPQPQP